MNPEVRAVFFLNRGQGTFEPMPTTWSGLDGNGICGEAADLNNDGVLDLVFAADPHNSGLAVGVVRYESKVYWNTGEHGAKNNRWLRFSGVTHAELIGARVEVSAADKKQYRWIHSNHSYKSGGTLEVHFGLGKQEQVDITVILINGSRHDFPQLKANHYLDLNLTTGSALELCPRSIADKTNSFLPPSYKDSRSVRQPANGTNAPRKEIKSIAACRSCL